MNESDVLRQVSQRVREHKSPLVLLDLDSTLYEVGPRTYAILKDWARSKDAAQFPEILKALQKVQSGQVGYSIRDTFHSLGLDPSHSENERGLKVVKNFWAERFFSNRYLPHDHPYPGAAHFAQELHRLGASLVYLTGRDEPKMGEGTRANLVRDGFPWNTERTHLLLKPHSSMPDLAHKTAAADFIRAKGDLVASFENEPVNLVALWKIFPDAMHVFVDTVCSDHPAEPGKNLYRISGFAG